MKKLILLLLILSGIWGASCDPSRRTGSTVRPGQPSKPTPGKPVPMDTIRWSTPSSGNPPIGPATNKPSGKQPAGATYHIGFLLPFLSNQMSGDQVPDKSRLALQFYAGAKLALEQLSREENIHLNAEVWDTQANDADFEQVMNNTRLTKPTVFIGPIRSSHVSMFAGWAKSNGKILISPETPSSELTSNNPDFIQINPSLRAHCETISRYVNKRHKTDAVTLVCKEKEADRLTYFQNAASNGRFNELIMPDDARNFDKTDLKKYLRPGKTAVFILPIWASQDFVMAFLRKLKEIKGSNRVEVYGMPQWRSFEAIEPEYLSQLNVHITSASWVNYQLPEIKAFQEKFYEITGAIPDEDAFNGYDVTLFTGRMLAKYGLSFPEHLDEETSETFRGRMRFQPIYQTTRLDDRRNTPDYWENTFVHLLKFDAFRYVPAE